MCLVNSDIYINCETVENVDFSLKFDIGTHLDIIDAYEYYKG
jgi:hypothetical protein